MKKFAALLLLLTLLMGLAVPALAASGDYTFTLETSGTGVVGDTITVKLQLSENGGGTFDLYGMQDYVYFDPAYFSYVDQSLSVYSVQENGTARDVFTASPLDYDGDGVIERVFVNRASTSAETLSSGVQVMEFKLKLKAAGSAKLTQGGVEIFKDPSNPYGHTAGSATVTIRSSGSSDPTPAPGGDDANGGSGTGSDTSKNPFRDVHERDYFYDAVLWAVGNGITTGTSANTFSPDDPCTRAQIVTFLWRTAGSPEPETGSNPFRDVSASAYYYKAVLWAVENGVTKGTSDTTFSPDAPCTRGQSVTFLYRAIGTNAGISTAFRDVAATAFYAEAVAWAVKYDVTNGIAAGLFGPDRTCTRAQIVTFLYRAYRSI